MIVFISKLDQGALSFSSPAFSSFRPEGEGLFTNLEVNDHSKDKDGGEQAHEVGQVLPVKGFSQGPNFVCPSGQQVEESNDGAFKLGA